MRKFVFLLGVALLFLTTPVLSQEVLPQLKKAELSLSGLT